MVNNYSQATVEPVLPNIFTELEFSFLQACGFESEISEDGVYFYAPESFCVDTEYALERLPEELDVGDLTLTGIFQRVIRESEGKVSEIVIMEAYTCDKMRMGEFGGAVTRITADCVQEAGTYSILTWFRKNPGKQLITEELLLSSN